MKNFQFCFIMIMVFNVCSSGQDSLSNRGTDDSRNFLEKETLMRFGLGYQKSFYTELGIAMRKDFGEDLFIFSTHYYSAIEWNPKLFHNEKNIFAIKFGGEISVQPLMIGLEMKYQSDFKDADYILTPGIGIGDGLITGSVLSSVYLCYGYNISMNHRPFEEIGRHQISLILHPFKLSSISRKQSV